MIHALNAAAMAAIIALIASAAGVALRYAAALKNTELRAALTWALDEAQKAADTIVEALDQSIVGPAKTQGNWNPTLAHSVKQQAVTLLTNNVAHGVAHRLSGEIPSLPEYYGILVERAVRSRRAS